MKLLVYIQNNDGVIAKNSLETLSLAQDFVKQYGGTVSALCFNENLCTQLANYNIKEVIHIDCNELSKYDPMLFVKALQNVIKENSPTMVLFGHTYEVRDWVPRLSARLNIPFISDCIGINNSTNLSFVRQSHQGKINVEINMKSECILVSIQSGTFKIDNLISGTSDIKIMNMDLSNIKSKIISEEKFQESSGGVDLTRADIIVSVGRGIGKEENLPIVKDLAKKIGAELGSSRPVVDAGWLDHSRQIGSSGQVVSPKLYFSIGISGAIQHQVGMKGSNNIVAINKDKNAPIFEIADYAVVGDLLEIVPKLIENL